MNVLLFGATGTAGRGILLRALADPRVASVNSVSRRSPRGIEHTKLHVFLTQDFDTYADVREAFDGRDACLFALGISVSQVSGEAEYRRITIDYPVAAAKLLRERSPGAVFHYVSGEGASERSWQMWARVKAEAEQRLIREFGAVCWRPAGIDGELSDNAPAAQRWMRPMFKLLAGWRSMVITAEDIGRAMLASDPKADRGRIIRNVEMRDRADADRAKGN